MKKLTTVVAALALCLIAVSSALGQSIVCTERVNVDPVTGVYLNWYTWERHVVMINGVNFMVYNPGITNAPNYGTYPVGYYYMEASGGPTSDTFSGIVDFTFYGLPNGVVVEIHYQVVGEDWDVSQTTVYPDRQVARCPRMRVPKGGMISFVLKLRIESWVTNGTPMFVELRKENITGLVGETLGKLPEYDVTTYTGPWQMTWLRSQTITRTEKSGTKLFLTVASPPHYWKGNWGLETSTNLVNWARTTANLLPPVPVTDTNAVSRILEVPFNGAEPYRFFRTVLVP